MHLNFFLKYTKKNMSSKTNEKLNNNSKVYVHLKMEVNFMCFYTTFTIESSRTVGCNQLGTFDITSKLKSVQSCCQISPKLIHACRIEQQIYSEIPSIHKKAFGNHQLLSKLKLAHQVHICYLSKWAIIFTIFGSKNFSFSEVQHFCVNWSFWLGV